MPKRIEIVDATGMNGLDGHQMTINPWSLETDCSLAEDHIEKQSSEDRKHP